MFSKELKRIVDDVEQLKKELSTLAKSQPSNQESSNSNWTTIYDMDSTDESVNLGLTSGMQGAMAVTDLIPDLSPYSKLKITFFGDGNIQDYYFDITETSYVTHSMTCTNQIATAYISMTFITGWNGEKKAFVMGNCAFVIFDDKALPRVTYADKNSGFYIKKIQAK